MSQSKNLKDYVGQVLVKEIKQHYSRIERYYEYTMFRCGYARECLVVNINDEKILKSKAKELKEVSGGIYDIKIVFKIYNAKFQHVTARRYHDYLLKYPILTFVLPGQKDVYGNDGTIFSQILFGDAVFRWFEERIEYEKLKDTINKINTTQ